MSRLQRGQMSDSYFLGVLLAAAGGFLDAYTYLLRGGVFANAQTGNVVLLGISLAEGDWLHAGHCLLLILTFAAGVWITQTVRERAPAAGRIHWRQVTLGAEIAALIAVAFLPLGEWDAPANMLVSFVCALQAQTFRKVDGNSMATTMCTGNLRSGTELLFRFQRTGERPLLRRAWEYYGIILAFAAGAALGGVSGHLAGSARVVLIPAGIQLLAFLLMFRKDGEEKPE